MYTIGNLQENLEGSYKFNASLLEMKPLSFVEKPKKSKRIVYSIRLGQINNQLLWVNHKDYAAQRSNVLTYSWDTFTEYCFSYGTIPILSPLTAPSLNRL